MDALQQNLIYVAPAAGVLALLFAWWRAAWIKRQDAGNETMRTIASRIQEGAMAFLAAEYRSLALFVVLVGGVLAAANFRQEGGVWIAVSFVIGAVASALAGFFGMRVATNANVRTTQAATKGLSQALDVAFSGGAVMGMCVVGLGLVGLGGLWLLYTMGVFTEGAEVTRWTTALNVITGFSMGASSIALFARVGGGIYTKAADVGADLVGKVEAGMEEDDPRNAAVIADLVGDNVGDCAGMAADIFESYEVTVVASLILGLALAQITGNLHWIIVPLLIRGVGVISSIIGTYAVSLWKNKDAEAAMYSSYELSSAITITSAFLISYFYAGDLRMGVLNAIGVALAVAFNPLTAYATSWESKRVQNISAATRFGPALVILEGMSLGYLSSVWAVMVVIVALAAAILIFSAGLPAAIASIVLYAAIAIGVVGGIVQWIRHKAWIEGLIFLMWTLVAGLFLYSMEPVTDNAFIYILFGVSMIGVGMLSHTGNNVSMDTFGPIADNANGIGEVAGMGPEQRQIMADLDAAGNTTKAITKGVAIGSAVVAALSLYGSFFIDIQRVWPEDLRGPFEQVVNLTNPTVFVGLLIGGMLPPLFGGLLIKAVNRAASQMMAEVRRQLRIPAIWSGEQRPDYSRAVMISTRAAQAELVPLGTIAVLAPIVVGLLLKEQALGSFLAGVIVSGVLLAVYMANAGGAWDNAKKYVEDGNFGGKGTDNHAAAVVGDIVGDPLKDTAGPALNPMIKVMNLVGLIVAPIVVEYYGFSPVTVAIIIVGVLAIIWAVRRSDREFSLVGEGTEALGSTVKASAD